VDEDAAKGIDQVIESVVREHFQTTDVDLWFQPSAAIQLMTLGELIDRLTIVNLKLFKLKDLQAASTAGVSLALSAKADVSLCKERSNLKAAINEKLLDVCARVYNGLERSDVNEDKIYG
jgi:hypothetical protein